MCLLLEGRKKKKNEFVCAVTHRQRWNEANSWSFQVDCNYVLQNLITNVSIL